MDLTAILAALGADLRSAASAVVRAWNLIPSEWRAPAVLVTAAGSVLTAAKWWQGRGRLDVALTPNQYAVDIMQETHLFHFDLTVSNPGRSGNSLREVRCIIDGEPKVFTVQPPGLLTHPVAEGATVHGSMGISSIWIMGMGGDARLKIVFVPVRGRRRTFVYRKEDLLTEF